MAANERRGGPPGNDVFVPRARTARRGAILPIFAITFAMLLAFTGLSIDGGNLYYERQRAQAAADAGAYAGALELKRGASTWITPSAKEDAKRNGFDDADSDVTVTVNNPPLSGSRAGDTNFVEVIVQGSVPTTLLRVVGPTLSSVRARAVAGIQPDWGGPCILALNTNAGGAITVSGTANLNAPNCDVVTRSTANDAIVANGGGCIDASTISFATGQGTTGGYTANGQNCLSPEPIGSIPPEDPYGYLQPPNTADYTQQSARRTQISGNENDPPVTLAPGYYKQGIKITGGNVILSPGVYVVDGFEASGNASITGEGVTIINTGDGGLRNISIAGGVHSELSATNDATSPYNNVLFYDANPSNCGNPCDAQINGTSDSTFEGVMYFPNVHLDYVGTADQSAFSQIIADTIRFTGTSLVEHDWDASGGRTPTATRVSFAE